MHQNHFHFYFHERGFEGKLLFQRARAYFCSVASNARGTWKGAARTIQPSSQGRPEWTLSPGRLSFNLTAMQPQSLLARTPRDWSQEKRRNYLATLPRSVLTPFRVRQPPPQLVPHFYPSKKSRFEETPG